MTPDPLDSLLRDFSRQPLPSSPAALPTLVLAEVERRRQRGGWRRWLGVFETELLPRPSLALAAMAVAVAVGLMPSLWRAPEPTAGLARRSLHLESFSPRSGVAAVWFTSSDASSVAPVSTRSFEP